MWESEETTNFFSTLSSPTSVDGREMYRQPAEARGFANSKPILRQIQRGVRCTDRIPSLRIARTVEDVKVRSGRWLAITGLLLPLTGLATASRLRPWSKLSPSVSLVAASASTDESVPAYRSLLLCHRRRACRESCTKLGFADFQPSSS